MTPKEVLSIRAMQNLINKGWPNKGLWKRSKQEVEKFLVAFKQESGREMTFKDLKYKGVPYNGNTHLDT